MNQSTQATVKPKTARALFRAALRLQRQSWRNQVGRPPIPLSRQNHPWEPWETAWLQVKDLPPAAVLAAWTGRSTAEILDWGMVVMAELEAPEKKTKFEPYIDLTKEKTPMPKLTDDDIRKIYEEYYIGRSEPLSVCARKLNTNPQTFANRCRYAGLRLRTSGEGRAATKGQPWQWPGDEAVTLDAAELEPATNTAEPTPDPEPAIEATEPAPVEAEAPKTAEPEPAEDSPGPGRRAIVTHAAEFLRLPAHPQWPPQRRQPAAHANGYNNPDLADLAHLVRDLREAGAGVQIALNIELRVGSAPGRNDD